MSDKAIIPSLRESKTWHKLIMNHQVDIYET
jgi:hypothetical protein